jgi:hypothetical protein
MTVRNENVILSNHSGKTEYKKLEVEKTLRKERQPEVFYKYVSDSKGSYSFKWGIYGKVLSQHIVTKI